MRRLFFFFLFVGLCLAQNPRTAKFPGAIATDEDLLVGKDRSWSYLASTISDSDMTVTVATGDGSKFVGYSAITIQNEQILICSISDDDLTVCTGGRGFSWTDAAQHLVGVAIRANVVSWHHNQLAAELKAIEQSLIGTSYIGTFVRLGGTTSSFPALKRNGVGLEVWLADGSALTWVSSSTYILGASGNYGWSGRSKLTSSANGNIMLSNAAKDDFGLLQGGGITSGFPAWKRVGAGWESRTADDGGDTTIKGSIINAATGFRVAGAATSTHFLRGNGTNFVDAAIAAGDIAGLSPTWTGDHDFGGGTLQVPNSTTLPGTCAIGDGYMDTDATTGQRWYLCESTNVWVLQGGGGTAATLASTLTTEHALVKATTGSGRAIEEEPDCTLSDAGELTCAGGLVAGGLAAGVLTLSEAAGSGSNFRKLTVPDALTADLTFKWPDALPTAGQVLIWGAPAAGVSQASFGSPIAMIEKDSQACAAYAAGQDQAWTFNATEPMSITGYDIGDYSGCQMYVATNADGFATFTMFVPSNYDSSGTTTINLHTYLGSGGTATLIDLVVRNQCLASGAVRDTSTWNTLATNIDLAGAANPSTRYLHTDTLTMTNCDAGELMMVVVGRDAEGCATTCVDDDDGDTSIDTFTSNIAFESATVEFPVQ